MNELPDKFEVHPQRGFALYTIPEVVAKVNGILDYLDTHTSKEEIQSWAYTFLGDRANIRCDEDIKTVMVFRGDECFEFTLPEPTNKT